MSLRAPFPYYGGKTNLADQIAAHLPPHSHYVEPFAGSLAVLLAKPRSKMETVNDLDGDLMTFWRVLRDHPGSLATTCALTPHSRREQADAYNLADLDDLERARRVWVLLTQGRGATLRNTGWRFYRNPAGSSYAMPDYLTAYVERIPPAARRLHGVTLENRPALEVLADYGQHPDVLLYCDPPYLATARNSTNYNHEMPSEAQHGELLTALLECHAAVVLSGYPSPLYAEALADWHHVELSAWTGNGIRDGATKADGNRTEVLWSNRALAQDVLDFTGEAS